MKYNTACRLPAIFIFSFWCFSLAAQISAGYCITATGDSIPGKVSMDESSSNKLFFRPKNQGKWNRYQPKEIKKAILENGTIYLSHKIPFRSDTVELFFQSLVTGYYTLFKTDSKEEGQLFYLSSLQRPELVKVNYRALETQFKTYFNNCSASYNGRLRYTESSITNYVNAMNRCINPESTPAVIKGRTDIHKYGIGFTAFSFYYASEAYQESGGPKVRFPGKVKPGFGLTGKMQPAKNFTVRTGISYISAPLKTDSVVLIYDSQYKLPYHLRENIDLRYFEGNLGGSVNFLSRKKLNPFLGLGGVLIYAIKTSGTDEWFKGLYEYPVSRTKNIFISWYAQAGLKYMLNKRFEIESSFNYFGGTQQNRIIIGGDTNSPKEAIVKTNRFQLNISFTCFLWK